MFLVVHIPVVIESRKQSRSAFTLIEVLVVVTILCILAVILFPAFSSAREKARASVCLSNYHQIGLAIQMYATDQDGNTPPNGGSFSGIIQDCVPYTTRTVAIFACPDDYDRLKEHRAGSYRMPSLYQGLGINCGWHDPYNPGHVASPTSTTMAYEAEQDFAQSPILPTFRHSGGTQYLLFDGHTRWIKGISQDTDD